MTRSIHADLLTDQKKTAYKPSLQAVFQDNNLPHRAEQLGYPMTGFSGTPTASVATATSLIRARYINGSGIKVQRITDPTARSQWTTGWTTKAAGFYNYPALFDTGDYIVLVYQNTLDKIIHYKRSDDDGVTFGPEGDVAAPAYLMNGKQIGVSAGATRSGFFCCTGSTIYFYKYAAAADTWALEITDTMDGTIKSMGLVNPDNYEDYQLAIVIEDYAAWTDSALLLQPYTGLTGSPAVFGTPIVYAGLHGSRDAGVVPPARAAQGAAPPHAYGTTPPNHSRPRRRFEPSPTYGTRRLRPWNRSTGTPLLVQSTITRYAPPRSTCTAPPRMHHRRRPGAVL